MHPGSNTPVAPRKKQFCGPPFRAVQKQQLTLNILMTHRSPRLRFGPHTSLHRRTVAKINQPIIPHARGVVEKLVCAVFVRRERPLVRLNCLEVLTLT